MQIRKESCQRDCEAGVRGYVGFLENSGEHAIGGHRQQCMQWVRGQASLVWETGRVYQLLLSCHDDGAQVVFVFAVLCSTTVLLLLAN